MRSGQACSLLKKHNRKQGCHLMLKCPCMLQPLVPRWPAGTPTDPGFRWRSHSHAPAPCGNHTELHSGAKSEGGSGLQQKPAGLGEGMRLLGRWVSFQPRCRNPI